MRILPLSSVLEEEAEEHAADGVSRVDWQRIGYTAVFLLILLAGTLILHSLRKK